MIQTKEAPTAYMSKACLSCTVQKTCIRASAFNVHGKREYFISTTKEKPTTPEMQAGIEYHEMKQRGIPTVEELGGFRELRRRLIEGEKVVVKELRICTPTGFRGHADIVEMRRSVVERLGVETPIYNIHVHELKTGFRPTYLLQGAVYGMILADPLAMVHVGDRAYNLYPMEERSLSIRNVYLKFVILDKKGREREYEVGLVRDNMATEVGKAYFAAVKRRKSNFMTLHKRSSLYFLDTIPYCTIKRGKVRKTCAELLKEGINPKCGFEGICLVHPYVGKKVQMKFGKRKLLVKK